MTFILYEIGVTCMFMFMCTDMTEGKTELEMSLDVVSSYSCEASEFFFFCPFTSTAREQKNL